MKKVALITGINGQDGSYLAEFLLEKNYIVHGLIRRSSLSNTDRLDYLISQTSNLFLHYGDMTDSTNLIRIIKDIQPDEVYNLAAMSHVRVSFEIPEYVADADGLGTLRLLEAVRILKLEGKTRIYQASTSELFGKVQEIPQTEKTPFYPRSPYAVAKLYAYWITVNYREAYNIFACNGILFNHESPLRGETFVTRKITLAVSRIVMGLQDKITLGNLDSVRDWGHAKDYIRMMWLILQADVAEDWVISTGVTKSIREFIVMCFAHVGIELEFSGIGIDEVATVKSCESEHFNLDVGKVVVAVDPKYFRPTEVDYLVGDSSKAKKMLGWEPGISISDLVREMMNYDLDIVRKEKYLLQGGFSNGSSIAGSLSC